MLTNIITDLKYLLSATYNTLVRNRRMEFSSSPLKVGRSLLSRPLSMCFLATRHPWVTSSKMGHASIFATLTTTVTQRRRRFNLSTKPPIAASSIKRKIFTTFQGFGRVSLMSSGATAPVSLAALLIATILSH